MQHGGRARAIASLRVARRLRFIATMKATKSIIAACGAVGLLAVFLPYFSEGGLSISFWQLREMPAEGSGLLNGPNQVYLALACFLVPMLLGLLAVATKQLARWQAGTAAAFSALAFALEGVRKGLFGGDGVSTAFGGKLLFLAAGAGLVAAIVGLAKSERA
jgi:hypothetical protein